MVVHVGSNLHEANGYVQFGCRLEFDPSTAMVGRPSRTSLAHRPALSWEVHSVAGGNGAVNSSILSNSVVGSASAYVPVTASRTSVRSTTSSFFEERVTIDGGQRAVTRSEVREVVTESFQLLAHRVGILEHLSRPLPRFW